MLHNKNQNHHFTDSNKAEYSPFRLFGENLETTNTHIIYEEINFSLKK